MLGLKERRTIPVGGVLRPTRGQDNSLSGEGVPGVVAQFKEAGYPSEGTSLDFF